MRALACLLFALLSVLPAAAGRAAEVTDATGRTVTVPDHIAHVMPAGPPAAVLMAVLAPDLMLGWPHHPSPAAAAWLPEAVAQLPPVPTPEEAGTDALPARPDLILDYGTVNDQYRDRARRAQERTGIPTLLLDGDMARIPATFRLLGDMLGRKPRAEDLARFAEGVLAAQGPREPKRVIFVRGTESTEVAVPDGASSGLFALLGWTLLAPQAAPGQHGAFRPASVEQIAALDPDLILFGSPSMRAKVANSPDWRALRAVREHHAWVVPAEPFGWVEGPPSVNRLVGLAWLSGGAPSADIVPFAAAFHAFAYGHNPTPDQLASLRETLRPLEP
jgi:iron complex transport system substrate-binding protein